MRRAIAVLTATAAVLLAVGCNDDDKKSDSKATETPAAAATTPEAKASEAPASSAAPATSAAPRTSSAFLRPTKEQEQVLIAALTAIDPKITTKPDRAISRSVDTCNDIRTGKDAATVNKNAAYRYTGGDVTVDDAKATQIVAAIKTAYCKA